jgi:hypothetical protein
MIRSTAANAASCTDKGHAAGDKSQRQCGLQSARRRPGCLGRDETIVFAPATQTAPQLERAPQARASAAQRHAAAPWHLSLAVSAIAFAILSPGLFWGIPSGKAINGALRILAGDIPYRDFWTMYAPGQFYLVAALFGLFGTHVIIQGAAVLLLVAASAGVLFHILRVRLELGFWPAAVVVALFVAMEWRTGPEMSSYEPLVLCAFLAINALLRYFDGEGARHLAWAGVACGVGAWFKHDVAFYVVTASAAALVLTWIAARPVRPSGWVHPARAVALLAGSCGLTVLPVIAFFAWNAGPDAWQDLVRFPATDFRVVRGEPYPALPPVDALRGWITDIGNPAKTFTALTQVAVWILATMPQLVFVGGAAWLLAGRRRLAVPQLAAGVLFLSWMPFFWTAAHVQQNTHLSSMAILSLLLGALVWTTLPAGVRGRGWRRLLVATMAVYAVGMVLRPALAAARIPFFWSESHTTSLPPVRGIRAPDMTLEPYEPIASFVRAHVPPSEAIYVGVVRHDAIVISNQAFYYLAGRRSATRYNELHPGLADDPAYQQEMIDAIERERVRCVVLWRFGWDDRFLDQIRDYRRARLPNLGATHLDEYLQREFEALAEYGEFVLMWRRGVPRPGGW